LTASYVDRAAAAGITGFLHPCEAELLPKLADGKRCLEIGAFTGYSTWLMAQTALSVFSVDTFKANSAGTIQQDDLTTLHDYLRTIDGLGNVDYFVGTSAEYAGKIDKRTRFDFIFLDADHSYESVKQDIELWWPRVKKGGVMAFHDCYEGHGYFPGVYQAVSEKFGEPEGCEITLAWVTKR
jgi:predicted O-methyltransferase YrrM